MIEKVSLKDTLLIGSKVTEAQEKEKIDKLKKDLKDAEARVEAVRQAFRKATRIDDTNGKLNKFRGDMYNYERKVLEVVEKESVNLPKVYRAKVKEDVMKKLQTNPRKFKVNIKQRT